MSTVVALGQMSQARFWRAAKSIHRFTPMLVCSSRLEMACCAAVHVNHRIAPESWITRSFVSTTVRSTKAGEDSQSLSEKLNPMNWWREREKKKEEEKFIQKTQHMASKEHWTLADMHAELSESVSSWKATVAGWMGAAKDVDEAKRYLAIVKAMMEVMGPNATNQDLEQMTKLQKLKTANLAEGGSTTLEDVNILIYQFDNMCAMHRIFRKRKLEGKPLPSTMENAQFIIHRESQAVLSRKQKSRLKEVAEKKMKSAISSVGKRR